MIPKPEDLVHDLRAALAQSTALESAALLEDLAREVYDYVKFTSPEGGGLDSRDGPERAALGRVVDAAVEHHDNLRIKGTQQPTDGRRRVVSTSEATTLSQRHASTAAEKISALCRTSMNLPQLRAEEAAGIVEDLATLASLLPQALAQVSLALEDEKRRELDTMTASAVGVATFHLEEARAIAVDLYKLLDSSGQSLMTAVPTAEED